MRLKLYIIEIKNRLILLIFSFTICLLTSYSYKETLLFLTIKNLEKNTQTNSIYFISTNLTEIISSYFELSYLNASLLITILMAYHVLAFFKPAITNFEYNLIKVYVTKSFFFFFFGFYVFYFFFLPIFWNFFLNFQDLYSLNTMNVYFEGRIEEYINFYRKTCFLLIIISQLCVNLSLVLERVTNKIMFIKNSRKPIYLLLLVISTTITPPDVFSQLSTFFFFLIIFENLLIITLFKEYLVRKPIET